MPQWIATNLNGGGDPAMDRHPIQDGGGWKGGGGLVVRNTPSCLMLQNPEMSASLVGQLARIQT